ncbi:MAG TPA: hypothetical protein VG367_00665 [Mucilaginibacter sp.]|jgi:hypothetical protein|nr:hypothetical protein [Mucilaginibacter sp.]
MKTFITVLLLALILSAQSLFAQKRADKVLFSDTSVINASLSMNLKKIRAESAKPGKIFPAMFSCKMGDSININDPVSLEVRGHFRRDYCYLPPLKMIFKDHPNTTFYKLKSLKLINSCMIGGQDEQNLLKEYMCYKIYNMMTDMSFKARLLNLTYVDSSGKKPLTRHAFLLEDVKQVAKRNNCDDWSDKKIQTEKTNRRQMTMVAIFEYMIANTDWSVPADHNIRLIHSKTDSLSRPYVVPYDFDFSGLVNTSYSAPDERLGISSVRERIYRGFPRTMDELNDVLAVFKKQKDNVYAAINNFNLFTPATKKEMTKYLDEFYNTINDESKVRYAFITNARQ